MSPSRSILLVGEGNFSFSASVSQLHSETETSITATCLQRQEEALRHEGAASNIQIIKDSGGEVVFGVDCRKLGECASLQGRAFDRVVFNFPHCGRKSGVKKNRELLKNFFLSCVQVLAEDGEVHVSLCNGQGGTPVDRPKREWHNSWQVAAMAAEANLILTDVHPFESEKYQGYKCTGYRSQDKGFHVERALLHVFTRSLPYTSAQILKVEEAVEGENVQYYVPAELSDYIFRGFLCSGSVHPVRLVQDFILQGLAEKCPVSMTTETIPFLLMAKQLEKCCGDVDSKHCYWIRLLQKDLNCDVHTSTDKAKAPLVRTDTRDSLSARCVTSEKVDTARSKGAESLRSACSLDVDPEGESGLYMLRPSLLPHIEELLTKKEELINDAGSNGENEGNSKLVEVEGHKKEESCGGSNGVTSLLFGISGLVFRNVPINLWALPSFHELLLRGVFPLECKPIRLLGQRLEKLLAPYGVSLIAQQGCLRLMAQPMGLVGRVYASNARDSIPHVSVTVSLNLDLLAVLLFSLPDWRLLWSHDPRFLQQFASRPSPGTPFHPFSLFPEQFSFDISFWTGPTWEERKFHAVVREGSHGTVEQVKLIDTFSHPDLSQTSYCYRLIYRSNTHALSHTRALEFHQHLQSFLTSRLQVTIR
ncbi:ferredoxin-fold anticodon-binding domain-containing protein 1 [Micropterus dolomieu]|uniref:ferredoxin-fold anticodon-binding domain-containing protein 1 n=1 Tax=Micropterus dolomieu TaxID=147949 RepID=UPI001E8D3F22|nr:ferredoxin-fold anticodon-binding domain-containing protein 1 [Micropterus dolomieu]XP_045896462.1 ferredoxin-fold anticodon-binding domain-containing protein 1 [Micropterus dolomieu]XP_045896463.1 ferredoxin-fold anticodon-binding domain-containing protein 1 [Micropterus dolomieu]XP_045896464.1 ferredoxin-fold anticodon-binding domain-containing protein 1 [Micropterus dolomieu]